MEAHGSTQDMRLVSIQISFLQIGEIDTKKECFEADVLLRARWREPALDHVTDPNQNEKKSFDSQNLWNPSLYIDNVIGTAKSQSARVAVEHDEGGLAYVTERRRVKGAFLENMELWDFPFDIQDLSITIMSEKSDKEVEIIEDKTALHEIHKQSFIDEQEWYLYKYIESEHVVTTRDAADPAASRPALTVRCRSARRPMYFMWNGFSIFLLIQCLSLITFSVEANIPHHRLKMAFTLVLTTITYKFVLHRSLPRTSYLSYLDKYILGTLAELGIVCVWHGIVTLLLNDEFEMTDTTTWADNAMLCVFGFTIFVFNVISIAVIMAKPYTARKEMDKKEKLYIDKIEQRVLEKEISHVTFKSVRAAQYRHLSAPVLLNLPEQT